MVLASGLALADGNQQQTHAACTSLTAYAANVRLLGDEQEIISLCAAETTNDAMCMCNQLQTAEVSIGFMHFAKENIDLANCVCPWVFYQHKVGCFLLASLEKRVCLSMSTVTHNEDASACLVYTELLEWH